MNVKYRLPSYFDGETCTLLSSEGNGRVTVFVDRHPHLKIEIDLADLTAIQQPWARVPIWEGQSVQGGKVSLVFSPTGRAVDVHMAGGTFAVGIPLDQAEKAALALLEAIRAKRATS